MGEDLAEGDERTRSSSVGAAAGLESGRLPLSETARRCWVAIRISSAWTDASSWKWMDLTTRNWNRLLTTPAGTKFSVARASKPCAFRPVRCMRISTRSWAWFVRPW